MQTIVCLGLVCLATTILPHSAGGSKVVAAEDVGRKYNINSTDHPEEVDLSWTTDVDSSITPRPTLKTGVTPTPLKPSQVYKDKGNPPNTTAHPNDVEHLSEAARLAIQGGMREKEGEVRTRSQATLVGMDRKGGGREKEDLTESVEAAWEGGEARRRGQVALNEHLSESMDVVRKGEMRERGDPKRIEHFSQSRVGTREKEHLAEKETEDEVKHLSDPGEVPINPTELRDLQGSWDAPRPQHYEPWSRPTPTQMYQGVTEHDRHAYDVTGDTLTDSPCLRECIEGMQPMTCYYRFEVEWYHSMSKACFNCPHNTTDCFRPDCITADGYKRPLIVVNRQMPGPSIQVCHGDRIIVDLVNLMAEESTTIHWHGHHQRGTPYMDGVPYVTQCPIPPRSTFRYRYQADTPGTHFWHSHSGSQRADGAYGALIVRVPSRKDPNRRLYDQDLSMHIIQIMDWDHMIGVAKFLAHHHGDGNNKPPTLLVNGRGRFLDMSLRGESEEPLYVPTSRFEVDQGFRYRFRLINAGFLNCPIQVSIDNHNLTIVASDGSDLEPVEAESLVTYAGERFDFIVSANQKVNNYWIRLRGLMDCDKRFSSAHQVAVFHYNGAADTEPDEPVSYDAADRQGFQVNALNARMDEEDSFIMPELSAAVKDDITLKPQADQTFYISYDFYAKDNPTYHKPSLYGFHQVVNRTQRLYTPQLNHITMKLPTAPPLSQPEDLNPNMVCNTSSVGDCTTRFCECTHILRVPLGAVVELVIIDIGVTFDANHPFHLHGTAFRVVAMDRLGSNTTVEEVKALDKAGKIKRKLQKAPVKDTVTVPDGGYTIVRFHANNPGVWLLHCHIEFHVEMGMALIFQVGELTDLPPVPPGFPRCGNYLSPEEESEIEVIELNSTKRITDTREKILFNLPPQYMVPPVIVIGEGSRSATLATSLIIISTLVLLLR